MTHGSANLIGDSERIEAQHIEAQHVDAEASTAPAAAVAARTELPPGLDAALFKLAFRHHAAGVAVVTADAGQGPVGMTVTSVFSVSAEPPLLVFAASAHSSAAATIANADTVVVHLLASAQLPIARLCATKGVDRFADTTMWDRLPTGEPYYVDTPVWIRGRIINTMDAGDSKVIVVHALEAHAPDADVDPLVYHNRTWHELSERSMISDTVQAS
ncbi:MAG: flavin reductase family protein [Microbacteriaceae bacterium]